VGPAFLGRQAAFHERVSLSSRCTELLLRRTAGLKRETDGHPSNVLRAALGAALIGDERVSPGQRTIGKGWTDGMFTSSPSKQRDVPGFPRPSDRLT
jgi:hypothetical protein